MRDRIIRLKERALNARFPICTKKYEIAMRTLKEYPGATPYWKRVLILENFLQEMPVYIPDDELIVGEGASRPYGVEMDYENGMWSREELDDLLAENGLFYLEPEEEKFCRACAGHPEERNRENLNGLWADCVLDREDLAQIVKSGVLLRVWNNREMAEAENVTALSGIGLGPGFVLHVPDYEYILNKGARCLIDECREKLCRIRYVTDEDYEKREFYQGVIRVYEAWIGFANRYAECARQMAEKEKDKKRREELLEIMRVCRKVPEYPAESFREALQCFWFVWIMVPAVTNSVGRFDQYMIPFYRKDLMEGRLSREDALELLESMHIRHYSFNMIMGATVRGAHSGMPKWFNYTIGGTDRQGNDASNELTDLLMDAALDLMIPHPTLTLRVSENTPQEVIRKAFLLIRSGLGFPALVSDTAYEKFFVDHGVPLQDARDYALTGCLDGNIPAETRIVTMEFVNAAMIFDIFLHNGVSRFCKEQVAAPMLKEDGFATFDEFLQAFYLQMEDILRKIAEITNIYSIIQGKHYQEPFRSGLMKPCIEQGKDILQVQLEPFDNFSTLILTGGINVADGLAAIRKLVFEEKKYTFFELMEALDHNWDGYGKMRKDFLDAPKYGNNDDYVDEIAADLYKKFAEQTECCRHPHGRYICAGISISAHQPMGMMTGATPDGRLGHTILADGSVSPVQGRDVKGPLSAWNSALKICQSDYNATLLNSKFHTSCMRTAEDTEKIIQGVRVYLSRGGRHIQINTVNRETLLAAQQEPEMYRDLTVRVAGYSAYFTQLSPMMQKEVIDRTEFH